MHTHTNHLHGYGNVASVNWHIMNIHPYTHPNMYTHTHIQTCTHMYTQTGTHRALHLNFVSLASTGLSKWCLFPQFDNLHIKALTDSLSLLQQMHYVGSFALQWHANIDLNKKLIESKTAGHCPCLSNPSNENHYTPGSYVASIQCEELERWPPLREMEKSS